VDVAASRVAIRRPGLHWNERLAKRCIELAVWTTRTVGGVGRNPPDPPQTEGEPDLKNHVIKMCRNTRASLILACAGLVLALAACSASAAVNYTVDWMQMVPTPFGSAPPFTGTYNLPGVGVVQMSYTGPLSDFAEARFQNPAIASGSISYGGDTYSWNNNEMLARTNWAYSGVLNSPWQVTYTFSSTIPAGQLILGVSGLGRRDPNANENPLDCISTASVSQNGTFLGDWINGNNWGPTLFSGGAGNFSMENSLTGPGGADPWWNTGLALVRIDDPVSSLTVYFHHTAGDGVGVNIGVVPEPSTVALLCCGLAGLLCYAWRKRK
jgi:hypothetical protein